MTALLHKIIGDIEYDRIRENIKIWRWKCNIANTHQEIIYDLMESQHIFPCSDCDGLINNDSNNYMLHGEFCDTCQLFYHYDKCRKFYNLGDLTRCRDCVLSSSQNSIESSDDEEFSIGSDQEWVETEHEHIYQLVSK